MIAYPFKMTDEIRERLLAYRTNPSEYWFSEAVYAWEYPSDSFKDDFGTSYMIWRDTKTDELVKILVCIDNKELYSVEMKNAVNLMFNGPMTPERIAQLEKYRDRHSNE